MTKSLNRRQNDRHIVPDSSLIFCNNRVGQIVNLSEDGMAVNLSSSRKTLPVKKNGTIYFRSTIKEIDKLQLKIVRSEDVEKNGFGKYASQTIGVKFDNLDEFKQTEIKKFLQIK